MSLVKKEFTRFMTSYPNGDFIIKQTGDCIGRFNNTEIFDKITLDNGMVLDYMQSALFDVAKNSIIFKSEYKGWFYIAYNFSYYGINCNE